MENHKIKAAFSRLSTPLIADACVRLGLDLHMAPPGLRPLVPGWRAAGRALPARHYGSVDVFFEAIEKAQPGDVLVVDNGGRSDEGCVGDLTALEALQAGLSGIVIWGAHRDTTELAQLGFPVFSYGTCPAGPRRLDSRPPNSLETARLGDVWVGPDDVVFADDDGALFVPGQRVEVLLEIAESIWQKERAQAEKVRVGTSLREQLRFGEYLHARSNNPSYTFRQHLRSLGGAIEE
ncbi:MAG: RraA family protein [Bacillota bacterium]